MKNTYESVFYPSSFCRLFRTDLVICFHGCDIVIYQTGKTNEQTKTCPSAGRSG